MGSFTAFIALLIVGTTGFLLLGSRYATWTETSLLKKVFALVLFLCIIVFAYYIVVLPVARNLLELHRALH